MSANAQNDILERRYDFAFVFDVTNGNPNGDPDAGNAPRVDPETWHGLVSDVCLKRKIRNTVALMKANPATGQPEPGYDIYVKHQGVLNAQHQRAYDAMGLKDEEAKTPDAVLRARKWMCQTFFDVRTFGAVMSTGVNCGQVRGPVQFTFSRSVDPIMSLPQSITRKAVTTEEEAEKQIAKHGSVTGTMGSKDLVPYALYVAHGFISPHLAADTGFTNADLGVLWQAIGAMFEHDHSATRGEMIARRLIAFEHESRLGNAPAHRLFERVTIRRKDEKRPARAYGDYEVKVDDTGLPQGIAARQLI